MRGSVNFIENLPPEVSVLMVTPPDPGGFRLKRGAGRLAVLGAALDSVLPGF